MPLGEKSKAGPATDPRLAALEAISAFMTTRVELDVEPVFEETLLLSGRALGAPMACLHLADEEARVLNLVVTRGFPPLRTRAWHRLALGGDSLPARTFAAQAPLEVEGRKAGSHLAWVAAAPVRGLEITLGVVSVLWPVEAPPASGREGLGGGLAFLATVGNLLGLAIEHGGLVAEMVDNLNQVMQLKAEAEGKSRELADLNRKLKEANLRLEELSVTDGLTGVFNHRKLHQLLGEELVRSRRLGHPVCLLMSDLDHFKRVNDHLGHQHGDEALKLFARELREGVREVDAVGRYGGEEFMVILVDCALSDGVAVADKLRARVQAASRVAPFDRLGGFTVSVGVAQFREGMAPEQLIAAADQALYEAKRRGRNQVVAAGGC